MDNKTDHVFHVWINAESTRLREWEKANPTGETTSETRRGKTVEVPTKPTPPRDMIDPFEHGLYSFKSAMQLLRWLPKQITQERLKTLPMVHQQCSHSPPEPLKENYLQCGLGERLDSCPILKRLRAKFDEERTRKTPSGDDSYYATITDEQIDEVAANVCVWHMLMGNGGRFIDWNEGAVQDCSDRQFWNRVYENLAGDQPENPEAED